MSDTMEKNGSLEKPASTSHGETSPDAESGTLVQDDSKLSTLGYKPELHRNRSLITLLFQSLAIAAIPYGEGSPLISAIYGGGQLSIFLGWVRTSRTHFQSRHNKH